MNVANKLNSNNNAFLDDSPRPSQSASNHHFIKQFSFNKQVSQTLKVPSAKKEQPES